MSNQPQAYVAVPAVAPTIDERCTFERACREGKVADNFAFQLDEDDGYKWAATRRLFRFWQAARAAIPAGADEATALQFWNHAASPTDDILGYRSHMQEIVGPAGYVKWEDVKGRLGAGAPAAAMDDDCLSQLLAERRRAIVRCDAEAQKEVESKIVMHVVVKGAAQPSPAPATDARDGERYRKLKTLSKPQLLIWRGAFGCSDEAIDELLDMMPVDAAMLSANSPPTDITT